MFRNFLLVGLGGFLGSMLRYAAWVLTRSVNFPYATLLVNITGSLVIGILAGLAARGGSFSLSWRLFLATGICGGFTTFSAFSLENLQMFQQEKYLLAITYIGISIIAGIAAAWLGFKLAGN